VSLKRAIHLPLICFQCGLLLLNRSHTVFSFSLVPTLSGVRYVGAGLVRLIFLSLGNASFLQGCFRPPAEWTGVFTPPCLAAHHQVFLPLAPKFRCGRIPSRRNFCVSKLGGVRNSPARVAVFILLDRNYLICGLTDLQKIDRPYLILPTSLPSAC